MQGERSWVAGVPWGQAPGSSCNMWRMLHARLAFAECSAPTWVLGTPCDVCASPRGCCCCSLASTGGACLPRCP